jgi:HD superfamily phosphohydrolase
VEEKGIYSIENFLNARRLMYWQVYLHKTAVVAEQMLILAIKRARDLMYAGKKVFSTPCLATFLNQDIRFESLKENILDDFMRLDDSDIWASLKMWVNDDDFVLSNLSNAILNRQMFKIELRNEPIQDSEYESIKEKIEKYLGQNKELAKYFLSSGVISNKAYISKGQSIKVKTKNNIIVDIAEASDLPNIKAISKIVKKYYICYPKTLNL